jgi:hypothetical protein
LAEVIAAGEAEAEFAAAGVAAGFDESANRENEKDGKDKEGQGPRNRHHPGAVERVGDAVVSRILRDVPETENGFSEAQAIGASVLTPGNVDPIGAKCAVHDGTPKIATDAHRVGGGTEVHV